MASADCIHDDRSQFWKVNRRMLKTWRTKIVPLLCALMGVEIWNRERAGVMLVEKKPQWCSSTRVTLPRSTLTLCLECNAVSIMIQKEPIINNG